MRILRRVEFPVGSVPKATLTFDVVDHRAQVISVTLGAKDEGVVLILYVLDSDAPKAEYKDGEWKYQGHPRAGIVVFRVGPNDNIELPDNVGRFIGRVSCGTAVYFVFSLRAEGAPLSASSSTSKRPESEQASGRGSPSSHPFGAAQSRDADKSERPPSPSPPNAGRAQ